MSKIPSVDNAATRGGATPVQPTRQAVLPPSPAVRQTSTHPALTGMMPGSDSMAAFQAAAQAAVDRIMSKPGR